MKTCRTIRLLLVAGCAALFAPLATLADDDPLREKALLGDHKAEFALGDEYFYGTETRKV